MDFNRSMLWYTAIWCEDCPPSSACLISISLALFGFETHIPASPSWVDNILHNQHKCATAVHLIVTVGLEFFLSLASLLCPFHHSVQTLFITSPLFIESLQQTVSGLQNIMTLKCSTWILQSLNLCLHSCSCKHWRIVQVALEGSVLKAVRLNRLGLVLAHQKILTANRLWRKKINPRQMIQWCDVKIIRVGSKWKASC